MISPALTYGSLSQAREDHSYFRRPGSGTTIAKQGKVNENILPA